jgi:hypothetical protein
VAEVRVRRDGAGFVADESLGTGVADTDPAHFQDDQGLSAGDRVYYAVFMRPEGLVAFARIVLLTAVVGKTALVSPRLGAVPAITVDGNDTEAFWAEAQTTYYSSGQAYGEDNPQNDDDTVAAHVRVTHDTANLYLFVRVTDLYLHVDPADDIWKNDAVELYLDVNFDRDAPPDAGDFGLILVPGDSRRWLGQGNGSDWVAWAPASTQIAVAATGTVNTDPSDLNDDPTGDDTDWAVELAIPIGDLGLAAVAPGTVVGFALRLGEDDIQSHTDWHPYDWTPDLDGAVPSADPTTWGVLQF